MSGRNISLVFLIQIGFLLFSELGMGAVYSRKAAIQKPLLFFENSKRLVTKAPPPDDSKKFYSSYVQNIDARITLLYRERFDFHDQNLPFRSSSWRGEFISNSVASGSAVFDWQAREAFAKEVFRMRVQEGVRQYLRTFEQSEVMRKAQGTLEALQNLPLSSKTQSNRSRAQLRFGFDILADSSKLEYVGGAVDVRVYKNRMLANPTDQNSTQMTASKDLGPSLGRASISVPFSAEQLQTTISKQLSPTIATSLSSTQPLKARQTSSYFVNLAFSF